jgi:hypothetical protein
LKKFLVPVTWKVETVVMVEAENIEDAIHEAHCVDIDNMPDPEYVGDSFEITSEDDIQEVSSGSYDPDAVGDFSTWDKMPGGF